MRSDNQVKFCVTVSVSGDIIAMCSMVEAVKVAAYLNIEFLEAYRAADRGGEDGLTPCCFASPAVWPYDPELHERALKEQQAQAAQCKPLHWLSSVA